MTPAPSSVAVNPLPLMPNLVPAPSTTPFSTSSIVTASSSATPVPVPDPAPAPSSSPTQLVHDGCTYVYHKKRASGYIAWRCDQTNKAARDKGSACPSTAVKTGMTSTSTLEYSRDNPHPPPTGRTGALILKNNIKTAGTTDRTAKPHRILGDTLNKVPEHVENHLHLLHIPRSLLSPWKVFDYGPSDTRILVLATDSNHDFLCKSIRWCGDRNFKAAPKLWTQLYTIHGQKSGYTVPCDYALLPNKRKETYVRLFTQMKSWVTASARRWETFLSDYEQGAFGSMVDVFPGILEEGCFFHLCKRLDFQVKERVKKLAALTFVPVADVVACFQSLSTIFLADELPLLAYFEGTWIGQSVGGRRPPFTFPHHMWNVLDRSAAGST